MVTDGELYLAVDADNGRMLRNFVQILRSGQTGRKSLGTAPKRLVQTWLESAGDRQLLNASVGQPTCCRPGNVWRST